MLIEADNDADFPWTCFRSPSCLGDSIPSPSWFPVMGRIPSGKGRAHTGTATASVHAQHTHVRVTHIHTDVHTQHTHEYMHTRVHKHSCTHATIYMHTYPTRVHNLQGRYERERQMHEENVHVCESILNNSKRIHEKELSAHLLLPSPIELTHNSQSLGKTRTLFCPMHMLRPKWGSADTSRDSLRRLS